MNISKVKAILAYLTGGVAGIVEYLLKLFNEMILSKVKDKAELAAYCTDVTEFASFLDGVFNRHEKWMSEAKRAALTATINAIRELAAALADANITTEELDAIVNKVVAAIKAWREAR